MERKSWRSGGRLAVGLLAGSAAVALATGPALAVSDAMQPRTPNLTDPPANLAWAEVKVLKATQYNDNPCEGMLYLYSRGILEGKGSGSLGFGTVDTTPWRCAQVGYGHKPTGCANLRPTTYHAKGNWRNENATNTTNVGVDKIMTCG